MFNGALFLVYFRVNSFPVQIISPSVVFTFPSSLLLSVAFKAIPWNQRVFAFWI